MAITPENTFVSSIAEWLRKCEKTLDFVHSHGPGNLSVLEALHGDPKDKIYDPYGYMCDVPLNKKIKSIEDDNGKLVEKYDSVSGNLVVTLTTGEELSGRWVEGRREGQGGIRGPRLEKIGVKSILGQYKDGILTGTGRITMTDGSIREAWFQHGFCHGPVRGCKSNGSLEYVGHYKAGIPQGTCWRALNGGGWLVGCVDEHGQFSGSCIAFLYPDFYTALFGTFANGVLVKALPAQLSDIEWREGVLCPSFSTLSECCYCYWPSTIDDIQCPPLLVDPYEATLVDVRQSCIDGGGEGAFAKRDLKAGTVVAYYNGIRMKAGEKSSCGDDTGYAIFIEWNRDSLYGQKNGAHMDIPPKYHSYENYRASVGHKLNHSFTPNCAWANADHPCFGYVPSIITLAEVRKEEELTIHYMMDMEDAPEWYLDCWDVHSRIRND